MDAALTVLNDRYKLIERAGSGGMATVYKGQDLLLGRLVAVKVLHLSLTHDETFLRHFQREAHAAANLSHPNIVTVHDIGQAEGPAGIQYYIVMEYVQGQTLKQLLRRHVEETERALPVAQALDLAIQICAGIGYAHRANLVHCDVKPQNVLVTPDERVKVADFGIARAMTETSLHDADMLWGTPHYFSPEQAAGEMPTPASDVYAIGVILFEMLAGRLPFEADTLPGYALKHLNETPPRVSDFNPGVPEQLDRIINKILSKEPAGRYRTAGQLESILRTYRERSEQATGPIDPIEDAALLALAGISEPQSDDTRRAPNNAEHKTQVMEPAERDVRPHRSVRPRPEPEPEPLEAEAGADWTIILLGLTALVLLLGLIPLWYLVYQAWVR